MAPGPDFAMVVARSVTGGWRVGLATTFGFSAGVFAHTLFAAFGLNALLLTSALAFDIVKWVGAAYLIFLGVKALLERTPHVTLPGSAASNVTQRSAFWQAALTDLLNPKVALFFLAFLPQFIHPERGPVVAQFLVLGVLFLLVGLVWDAFLAVLAGRVGVWAARHPWLVVVQNRVSGVVMLALGIRLALSRRDAV
ncbi:lysine transporter LysE (plasmid) [Deinococcus aetherius]|uniref:Lysine transporter LysE n=1 Tax=Deinococcus aetherius TaxID=200252 RepID=A0ABM8AIQ8_9DEIO|nr:LysE family translocator [Deinococcus aetherius]BDP43689.1 lysine transporter LysE [Deinococcus aetherius]